MARRRAALFAAIAAALLCRCAAQVAVSTPAGLPPGTTLASLPETTISSKPSDQAFWATVNSTWQDSLDQICVYDNSTRNCLTNIGYYVHASGLDNATLALPGFQFYLRFQMREACHGAAIANADDSVGGTYCDDWAIDYSQFPLDGPKKWKVSELCRTLRDGLKPLGCANNFKPWSVETLPQWQDWRNCSTLPLTVLDPIREMSRSMCEQLLFELNTGWNYTVLFRMVDLVLQARSTPLYTGIIISLLDNGNDCNKHYLERIKGQRESTYGEWCEAGDIPAPAMHPVLRTLRTDPDKKFYGTFKDPLFPKARFAPPPPNPPPPPPNPPPPPSPPPFAFGGPVPPGSTLASIASFCRALRAPPLLLVGGLLAAALCV